MQQQQQQQRRRLVHHAGRGQLVHQLHEEQLRFAAQHRRYRLQRPNQLRVPGRHLQHLGRAILDVPGQGQ
jgi:hypothetical protein